MREFIKQSLETLSKEQLIKIIDDYKHCLSVISEACVSESKGNDASKKISDIRKYLQKYDKYKLYDENLSLFVDLQLGKISAEEYRDITLSIARENMNK